MPNDWAKALVGDEGWLLEKERGQGKNYKKAIFSKSCTHFEAINTSNL